LAGEAPAVRGCGRAAGRSGAAGNPAATPYRVGGGARLAPDTAGGFIIRRGCAPNFTGGGGTVRAAAPFFWAGGTLPWIGGGR